MFLDCTTQVINIEIVPAETEIPVRPVSTIDTTQYKLPESASLPPTIPKIEIYTICPDDIEEVCGCLMRNGLPYGCYIFSTECELVNKNHGISRKYHKQPMDSCRVRLPDNQCHISKYKYYSDSPFYEKPKSNFYKNRLIIL